MCSPSNPLFVSKVPLSSIVSLIPDEVLFSSFKEIDLHLKGIDHFLAIQYQHLSISLYVKVILLKIETKKEYGKKNKENWK